MFVAKNLRYLRVKNNLKQKDIQEIGNEAPRRKQRGILEQS